MEPWWHALRLFFLALTARGQVTAYGYPHRALITDRPATGVARTEQRQQMVDGAAFGAARAHLSLVAKED